MVPIAAIAVVMVTLMTVHVRTAAMVKERRPSSGGSNWRYGNWSVRRRRHWHVGRLESVIVCPSLAVVAATR